MSKSIITGDLLVLTLVVLALLTAPLSVTAAPAEAPAETEKAKSRKAAKGTEKKPSENSGKQQSEKTDPGQAPGEAATGSEETDHRDEADPALEKLRKEVEHLSLLRDKLVAENTIAKEEVAKSLAEREAATEIIEMELEEAELKMKQDSTTMKLALEEELEELRAEKERAVLAAEIAKAKSETEISRLKFEEEERRSRLSELTTEISVKEKTTERNNYTEKAPVYLENPLQGRKLVVSDRRISLNGLIGPDTAEYISERINYFNNKDSKMPIFIIIDNSPGGSVMSGYKILKAMEGSQAPVYVVVKSYAASMAACITTLAEKSFAYPNAVILHHQLSGFSSGNLTRQKEFVEEAEQWWLRLAGPIVDKMGVSLEEFVEMMYKNASTGDWVEFADEAKKLHWVDAVIDEIHETSLIKNPDAESGDESSTTTTYYGLEEQNDDDGTPFVKLPRLTPFDYYWLYNPDGYYR